MANFCGKCGCAIDPATGNCPNCNPAPAVAESKKEDKSSKPKSKKKILIPIIAAVLVVAILAGGGIFLLPKILGNKDKFITTGRDGLYFSNKYDEYYLSAKGLISTESSDDLYPYQCTYSYEGEEISDIINTSRQCVIVDNIAYAKTHNSTAIGMYDLSKTQDAVVESEIWIDTIDYDTPMAYALLCSWDWQYHDGYIYFYVTQWLEYAANMTDTLYQLMRIDIDTKEIEVVNEDISVDSYVIDGNWIYFYENGFIRTNNGTMDYNKDKAGIYRMKLDGSNKEKLLDFPDDADDTYWEYSSAGAYSRLGIYKNKLYYIDNIDVWDSRLYRMDLDGDNVERISDKATYEYTIDPDTGKLYYVTGSFIRANDEVKHIYEVSLKNLDNNKIAEYANGGDRFLITAKDGIVSIHSIDQLFGQGSNYWGTEDNPCVSGLYIDTKNEKITALYNYSTYIIERTDTGRGGIIEQQVIDKIYYYWDEYNGDLLKLK